MTELNNIEVSRGPNVLHSQDVNVLFEHGLALQQQGQLAEAATLYEQVLTSQPSHFNALHFLGLIAVQTENPVRAVELLSRAIEVKPGIAPVYFNRGIALQQLQRNVDAVASFDQAIAIQPEHFKAYFRRGLALQALRRTEDAIASYDSAIAIRPTYGDASLNRGIAFSELQKPEDALASFERAVALLPDHANAHLYCGLALADLQRFAEAVASYERVISIQPAHCVAHINRGKALHALGRNEEALESFDLATSIDPASAEAYNNRGTLLHALGRYGEALASLDQSISIRPNDAEFYYKRAMTLEALSRFEDALESYDKAIEVHTQACAPYWNKSLMLLSLGRYEEGWPLHEWRWKLNDKMAPREFSNGASLWLGEQCLAGKTILLHAEQGHGDAIQFCRYAKLVKALGATVILEVPGALMGLLSELEGVDQLIERGADLPSFNYHCPLMSLPLTFKTRIDSIPSSAKYLHAQPAKVTQWQRRLGPTLRPRVGLVWSGGFRPDQPEVWAINQRRNLPLGMLGILDGLPVDFISLQKGEPAESEFAAAGQSGWLRPAIADYGADLNDFSDTAALIENLDLVISVDTSVAHLAAALGKPVWILNRFDSCWRWLKDRTDSPWYPTLTLYNQHRAGDWEDVMYRVRQDLFNRLV